MAGGAPAPEVLCLGESMAVFVPLESGPAHTVRTWNRTIGGAESNVACHLAALGTSSAWVSAVGADPFGRALVEEIAASGVDVTATYVDPERPTGVYFKEPGARGGPVRYYRAGSAASGMGPGLLAELDLGGVRLIHLSGITPALSPSCAELVRAVLTAPREGRLVSFDVNWRPALWPGGDGALLAELANLADIVLVGDDEAEVVWGTGGQTRRTRGDAARTGPGRGVRARATSAGRGAGGGGRRLRGGVSRGDPAWNRATTAAAAGAPAGGVDTADPG